VNNPETVRDMRVLAGVGHEPAEKIINGSEHLFAAACIGFEDERIQRFV
jgi:hypothetical protein